MIDFLKSSDRAFFIVHKDYCELIYPDEMETKHSPRHIFQIDDDYVWSIYDSHSLHRMHDSDLIRNETLIDERNASIDLRGSEIQVGSIIASNSLYMEPFDPSEVGPVIPRMKIVNGAEIIGWIAPEGLQISDDVSNAKRDQMKSICLSYIKAHHRNIHNYAYYDFQHQFEYQMFRGIPNRFLISTINLVDYGKASQIIHYTGQIAFNLVLTSSTDPAEAGVSASQVDRLETGLHLFTFDKKNPVYADEDFFEINGTLAQITISDAALLFGISEKLIQEKSIWCDPEELDVIDENPNIHDHVI